MWGVARELAAHATNTEGGNGAGGGEESSSFKQQIEIPLAVSADCLCVFSVVLSGVSSRILFSFFDLGVCSCGVPAVRGVKPSSAAAVCGVGLSWGLLRSRGERAR